MTYKHLGNGHTPRPPTSPSLPSFAKGYGWHGVGQEGYGEQVSVPFFMFD